MAQWLGQFSGNTHLSKVQEREQQLRNAIDVLRSVQPGAGSGSQAQTVERLAQRLLDARVRACKARISALDPRKEADRIHAESKIEGILNGGIAAILHEFDASDIMTDRTEPQPLPIKNRTRS